MGVARHSCNDKEATVDDVDDYEACRGRAHNKSAASLSRALLILSYTL